MTDKGDQYIDEMLVAYGLQVPTWDDIPEWVWKAEVGTFSSFNFVLVLFCVCFQFCIFFLCCLRHLRLPKLLGADLKKPKELTPLDGPLFWKKINRERIKQFNEDRTWGVVKGKWKLGE